MKAIITIILVVISLTAFGQVGRQEMGYDVLSGKEIKVWIHPTYINGCDGQIFIINGVWYSYPVERGSKNTDLMNEKQVIETAIINSQATINLVIDAENLRYDMYMDSVNTAMSDTICVAPCKRFVLKEYFEKRFKHLRQ